MNICFVLTNECVLKIESDAFFPPFFFHLFLLLSVIEGSDFLFNFCLHFFFSPQILSNALQKYLPRLRKVFFFFFFFFFVIVGTTALA